MWIDDTLGHNAESGLIAASIKLLRRSDPNIVAVQSFTDGRLGCGTIYKASNFKYFGLHYTKFLRDKRTGEIIHQQIATNTTSPSAYLRANIATFTRFANISGSLQRKNHIRNTTKELILSSGTETSAR